MATDPKDIDERRRKVLRIIAQRGESIVDPEKLLENFREAYPDESIDLDTITDDCKYIWSARYVEGRIVPTTGGGQTFVNKGKTKAGIDFLEGREPQALQGGDTTIITGPIAGRDIINMLNLDITANTVIKGIEERIENEESKKELLQQFSELEQELSKNKIDKSKISRIISHFYQKARPIFGEIAIFLLKRFMEKEFFAQ